MGLDEPGRISYNLREQGMGMSESAVEGLASDTGVAETTGDATSTSEGHPEDQEAEEQLHQVMQAEDPDELKKEAERWRGLAQRHEKTARNNAADAKAWREQQDANKSELQKAQEARLAAEQERDALATQQNRMLAAAANDLSPDLIEFLGNGTAEEISDRAATLARLMNEEADRRVDARSKQATGNGRPTVRGQAPVGTMRSGSAPSTGANLTSPDQMFRQLIQGDDS
jgi:hypothetical protein